MYVHVDGARLFFDTVGSKLALEPEAMREKPTLIVLHGGPGFDHSTLRPYFDRFADTHQVLYLDHRANGRSGGDLTGLNLARWGQDVKAICDALGIEKPHVFGNSFGGFVAMAYAAQFPGHPGRLILSSTAARMRLDITYQLMEERGGPEARAIAERFWQSTDAGALADYARVCMPFYHATPQPGAGAGRGRAIMRPDTAAHFILNEMRVMDLRGGAARIACPALILSGAYDPVTPPVCAQEIAAALAPGLGEVCLFETAGHGVHRDCPDEAETVMRTFLAGRAP